MDTALSLLQVLSDQRVLRISGRPMKIANCKVRSIYDEGRLINLQKEARWKGTGIHRTEEDFVLYYCGGDDKKLTTKLVL